MKYPFMYYITRVTTKLEALFPLSVIHAIQGRKNMPTLFLIY